MNHPKFRMIILISLAVFFYTVIQLVLAVITPESPFEVKQYFWGFFLVGLATLGGFIFIWGCVKFITFERSKVEKMSNGSITDETGTQFNMPVHLNKFIPDVIAPPLLNNAHPLEEELLGFLNGFQHWPTDLDDPDAPSLKELCDKSWQTIQRIPNIDYPHRVAAIAQHLSKIYIYKESRKLYPIWMFWKPAKVTFQKRCDEHAGYSAFMITTMPSFNKLERSIRQAILTALRFKDTPTFMPTNASELTKSIYEALHQAEDLIQQLEKRNHAPTDAEKSLLHKEIADFFQSSVKGLDIQTTGLTSQTKAIHLGDSIVAFSVEAFIQSLIPNMNPALRSAFKLWQYQGGEHPAHPHFVQAFYNMGMLVDSFDDTESKTGLFNLKVAGFPFSQMVIVDLKRGGFLNLARELDRLPSFDAPVQVKRSLTDAVIMVRDNAKKMDDMLASFRNS